MTEKISIHNRNYKVRPEVKVYVEGLEEENRILKELKDYAIYYHKCDQRWNERASCTCGLDKLLGE